jgi:hypothetical protein
LNTPDGEVMMSGSQLGPIEVYRNLSVTSDSFPQVTDFYGNVDDGSRTHPALADIDDDGILEMVVGNQRGGLSLYKTTLVDCTVATHTQQAEKLAISITPNPSNAWMKVDMGILNGADTQWQVYNLLGQLKENGQVSANSFSIQVADWEPGIYFLELVSGQRRGVAKLMVK